MTARRADDADADDRAETLKDQREGRYMSQAEQDALSDRRAEQDERNWDLRWTS